MIFFCGCGINNRAINDTTCQELNRFNRRDNKTGMNYDARLRLKGDAMITHYILLLIFKLQSWIKNLVVLRLFILKLSIMIFLIVFPKKRTDKTDFI